MGKTVDTKKHDNHKEKEEKQEKDEKYDGEDHKEEKGEKKKKKEKECKDTEDKEDGEKEEKRKNPEKLRAKLQNIESKIQALIQNKDDVLKLLEEVEKAAADKPSV